MRTRIAALLLVVFAMAGTSSPGPARAQTSTILSAMQDEMKRSIEELRMKGEAPPYYISYEVLDRTIADYSGHLGAISETLPRRTRTLRVEVRVGDYGFDSSRFVVQGFGGQNGENVLAPLDDDYDALRREIWISTDTAYKRAISMFARKTAAFQNRATSDPIPDFSKEPAADVILPSPDPLDKGLRLEAVNRVQPSSAVFASSPDVDGSDVAVTQIQGTRYYVNSEGTSTVTPVQIAALMMYGEAQADDGMPVRETLLVVDRTVRDLPSGSDLVARARELAARVTSTRKAPLGEEFTGPVLLEGLGSAQFISETLVPMMQARRPPEVENPRMMQAVPTPLLNRTGLRVLSDAFTARDTPSLTQFDGRNVPGSYVVDDEGVRAKDVTLVDKGRLVTLLTGRTPQKNFLQSNGHGRSGSVLAGVFQLESAQAIPAAELKAKYLALLKAQDKTFGYIVRGVRSDGPGGPATGPGIEQAVRVGLDGTEEPVRGLRFGSVAHTAFRDLSEASKEQTLYSYRAGPTATVSIVAPNLIFEELEIQRTRDVLQKPPIVPSPLKE